MLALMTGMKHCRSRSQGYTLAAWLPKIAGRVLHLPIRLRPQACGSSALFKQLKL